MTRRLLIDTDPGIDDALALMLAIAASDDLTLCGVTTVAGNVPLSTVTANARRILALVKANHIPIVPGAAQALKQSPHFAVENHGENGLGGVALTDPGDGVTSQNHQHASDFLIDTVTRAPAHTYTLCCLGPLTNLALALQKFPDLATYFAEIVIIGGAFTAGGNVTETAEFNFYCDPEAAQIVLASSTRITLIPWDEAKTCLTSAARRKKLEQMGAPLGPVISHMLDFYRQYDEQAFGTDGGALPDPLAIAYLLQPSLFQKKSIVPRIELDNPAKRGTITATEEPSSNKSINLLLHVDSDGYFQLLTQHLTELNQRLSHQSEEHNFASNA